MYVFLISAFSFHCEVGSDLFFMGDLTAVIHDGHLRETRLPNDG